MAVLLIPATPVAGDVVVRENDIPEGVLIAVLTLVDIGFASV